MIKPLVLALCCAAAASADTVTVYFTGLPSTIQNGTYNGFAVATVNGIPAQLLICDDYADETYMPSSSNMIYDYSTLTGAHPLQYAMFDASHPASSNDILKYDEAAVLLYNLWLAGPGASSNTVTDYQYALWNLMEPSTAFAAGRASQEQALQASALAQVTSSSQQAFLNANVFPNLRVYTPTAQFQGNQEFLQYVTPEPSTFILLGSGLLLAAGAAKYFRKRQKIPETSSSQRS